MEFFIRKNATLPVLSLDIFKNGRTSYNLKDGSLSGATIFFSMVNVETNVYKVARGTCIYDPTNETVYYQFTKRNTSDTGRFEGSFFILNNQELIEIPLKEKLFINITESISKTDFCCRTIDDLNLNLIAIIQPGSVKITYIVNANKVVRQNTTVSFKHVLGTHLGEPIITTSSVTILAGNSSGSVEIVLNENYNNLTQENYFDSVSSTQPKTSLKIEERHVTLTPSPTDTPISTPTINPSPTVTPISTPTVNPTPTPTPTSTVTPTPTPSPTPEIAKTLYFGKLQTLTFTEGQESILDNIQSFESTNIHIPITSGSGYSYFLIPSDMNQPSLVMNSSEGCSGFVVPIISRPDVTIPDIFGNLSIYKVYRTYVSTYAEVDLWLCV